MNYDIALIDEAVLALLAAFSTDSGNTWKGYDFGVTTRLYEQGLIEDPVNKNKSLWLTPEGLERGRQIAERLFAQKG